jgi:hypothetical protein
VVDVEILVSKQAQVIGWLSWILEVLILCLQVFG